MSCPSDDTIVRFVQRKLSSDAHEAVDRHLADCDACLQLVAAAASEPEATGLGRDGRIGRYRILEELGAGGMGVVYRAHDTQLGRAVALKVLRVEREGRGEPAESEARLLREARAMAQLSHENVVAVYDAGVLDGRLFLAMELVEGTTLRQWLREPGRGWQSIVEVFRAAARGLAAAHEAGIAHRDFKPSNVLVARDGRIKVTDFGLARETRDASDTTATVADSSSSDQTAPRLATITETAAIAGTPAYMAPEVLLTRRASAKSDQFSFCVALHEALYGERPFEGRNFAEIGEAVLGGRVKPPPRRTSVPRSIARALARGLRLDPSARWPSMSQLEEALDARKRASRTRRAVLAGAIVVVAGAVALLGREAWWTPRATGTRARTAVDAPPRAPAQVGAMPPSTDDRGHAPAPAAAVATPSGGDDAPPPRASRRRHHRAARHGRADPVRDPDAPERDPWGTH